MVFVADSGCGKNAIIDLILHLYELDHDTVCMDGKI